MFAVPDCKTSISYEGSHFKCDNCQREFPFYDNAILEILTQSHLPNMPLMYAAAIMRKFTTNFFLLNVRRLTRRHPGPIRTKCRLNG